MSTDWHAKGQQDREKARDNGWVDFVIGGGGSPHYNPPSDQVGPGLAWSGDPYRIASKSEIASFVSQAS